MHIFYASCGVICFLILVAIKFFIAFIYYYGIYNEQKTLS